MTRKELKEHNAHLFCKVIMQLVELETIAEDPTSDKAKEQRTSSTSTSSNLTSEKNKNRQSKINSTMSLK